MLALSASNLASVTDDRCLITAAINHRLKAIETFRKAIPEGITCFEQGNAMLATCFVLAVQSIFLDDGLSEYIAFLRGIVAIAVKMSQQTMEFVFTSVFPDDQLKMVEPGLAQASVINNTLVSAACRSLEKTAPLCKTQTEIDIFGLLLSMAHNLNISPRECEYRHIHPACIIF